jgi:hypothetical protein
VEVSEKPKLSPLNATKNQSYLDINSARKVLPKELMAAKELWGAVCC